MLERFDQIRSVAFKNKHMQSNKRMDYWPATHSSCKAESNSNHLSLQFEVFSHDFLDDSTKKSFQELKLHSPSEMQFAALIWKLTSSLIWK